VILCDEHMPGITGHEFYGGSGKFPRATRLMMSGYADMSALTEAVNRGKIFAYIDKPWEPLQLKRKLPPLRSLQRLSRRWSRSADCYVP